MARSETEWITKLHFAFQDFDFLYMVMEYLPGGDLLKLLYEHDTFEEDTARFYIAECIMSIESLHNMGYAHRFFFFFFF